MHAFRTKDLIGLTGLSRSRIRALVRAGHLRPRKVDGRELLFSFQDLIILRTAKALGAAAIPPRRISRSLHKLQQSLPPRLPLSGLSITCVGDQVTLREGVQQREIDSGQYVLALDVTAVGGEIRIIEPGGRGRGSPPTTAAQPIPADAQEALYLAACELEEQDPAAAIEAYARCLAVNPAHPQAALNCGRLLHMAGRLQEAERLYRSVRQQDCLLLFNLGVLLEDLGREAQAVVTYREALEADPTLADAHFNLARLFERADRPRDALRHLLAYRRLTAGRGGRDSR